jgi:hypothetical protein
LGVKGKAPVRICRNRNRVEKPENKVIIIIIVIPPKIMNEGGEKKEKPSHTAQPDVKSTEECLADRQEGV